MYPISIPPNSSFLDPRIKLLIDDIQTVIVVNLRLPLHTLHDQPFARMPRSVTGHQPAPRIIRLERNDQQLSRRQRHRISARRIVEIQLRGRERVGPITVGEHGSIMAVQIHRVIRRAISFLDVGQVIK